MINNKKAIIIDMDETLEHGIYQNKYDIGNGMIMLLRPHLDELITKIREAKKQGIDIILCTTARTEWVERFLKLKPEFREIFKKIYNRDNEEEWRNFNIHKYPLEFKAKNENINLESLKPITTFGYDSVLFIDDNKIEELRLEILFEITKNKLQKDVTYFSGFGFYGGKIDFNKMLIYKKAFTHDRELLDKIKEYIEIERSNPGCLMMCSAIDIFMNKDFNYGLTLLDEDYIREYNTFNNKLLMLKKELETAEYKIDKKLFKNSKYDLKQLLQDDKKIIYEGIEIY